MLKKIFVLTMVLILFTFLISCEKEVSSGTNTLSTLESTQTTASIDTTSTSETEVIYQGFILVDINKINDYAMPDNYVITNKDDWEIWNSKYTSSYPTSLDEVGINWDKECLVVRAFYGAKDSFVILNAIKDVSFGNNIVTIINDEDVTPICAFNDKDEINEYTKSNIAFYVIKVDKPSNLSTLKSHYFKYTTYSQAY